MTIVSWLLVASLPGAIVGWFIPSMARICGIKDYKLQIPEEKCSQYYLMVVPWLLLAGGIAAIIGAIVPAHGDQAIQSITFLCGAIVILGIAMEVRGVLVPKIKRFLARRLIHLNTKLSKSN